MPPFHVEHHGPFEGQVKNTCRCSTWNIGQHQSGAVVPDGLLGELGVGPTEVETGRGQRLRQQ
jgi:hypothetical protein